MTDIRPGQLWSYQALNSGYPNSLESGLLLIVRADLSWVSYILTEFNIDPNDQWHDVVTVERHRFGSWINNGVMDDKIGEGPRALLLSDAANETPTVYDQDQRKAYR